MKRLSVSLILILSLSCVRYLPEDSAYYRSLWQKCLENHAQCEDRLEDCVHQANDLLQVP